MFETSAVTHLSDQDAFSWDAMLIQNNSLGIAYKNVRVTGFVRFGESICEHCDVRWMVVISVMSQGNA